jgi:hypothetical protein
LAIGSSRQTICREGGHQLHLRAAFDRIVHQLRSDLVARRRAVSPCGSDAPSASRDGTIYKTFDDAAWIYHLGIKGTNGRYDKASVAIEFANELGLALDGDRLYAFGMNTPNTVYTGPFFAFDWRDYSYFAQLDEAQVDAGIELTLDICRRHHIEPSFYYPSTAFDFPRCFQVATIVCHSNCRRDKTDLALPDWVYERVEGAGIRLVS